MRYLVIVTYDGDIGFAKSFALGADALAVANDWITRSNINDLFIPADLERVADTGPIYAHCHETGMVVMLMVES